MTAGRACEAVRTGIHVRGNGDPVTRVGFTVQQALGQPVPAWGEGEMQVSAPVSEILATPVMAPRNGRNPVHSSPREKMSPFGDDRRGGGRAGEGAG